MKTKDIIKKFRIKKTVVLLLTYVLILSSCLNDTVTNLYNEYEGDGTYAQITMNVPAVSITRNGITEEQEYSLKDLDVLVFDKDSNFLYHSYGTDITQTNYQATARLKLFITENNDTISMAFLGNARKEINLLIQNGDLDLYKGSPISQVLKLIKYTIDNTQWDGTRGIPMWGETTKYYSIPENASSVTVIDETVYMLRAMAKVDVYYRPKTKDDDFSDKDYVKYFQFRSVHVMNIPEEGYVAPSKGKYEYITENNQKRIRATEATAIPNVSTIDSIKFELDINDIITGLDSLVNQIYIPEQTTEGIGLTNKLCLVIGGVRDPNGNSDFSGSIEYYRADFFNSEGDYLDVLRNHRYGFYITAVDGPGEATPGDALEKPSVNMKTEILTWDDYDVEEVYYDGYYWYYASPRTYYYGPLETVTPITVTEIKSNSKYTNISARFAAEQPQGADTTFFKEKPYIDPSKITSSNGELTAYLEAGFTEYQADSTVISIRFAEVEIVFSDVYDTEKVIIPVTIYQQSDIYAISAMRIEQINFDGHANERSAYVLVQGLFENLQIKAEIEPLVAAMGNYSNRGITRTLPYGTHEWADDGYTSWPDWYSIQIDNPTIGIEGWMFYKNDISPSYGPSTQLPYYYIYSYSLDNGQNWSLPLRSAQCLSYYVRVTTTPSGTNIGNIAAAGEEWNIAFFGDWDGVISFQVRDNDNNIIATSNTYSVRTATSFDNAPIEPIMIPANNSGVQRELHLWFSCSGKEEHFVQCSNYPFSATYWNIASRIQDY